MAALSHTGDTYDDHSRAIRMGDRTAFHAGFNTDVVAFFRKTLR